MRQTGRPLRAQSQPGQEKKSRKRKKWQSLNTVGRINPKQAMALHTENKAQKSYVICVFGVKEPSSGQLPASPSTHLQAQPIQAELTWLGLARWPSNFWPSPSLLSLQSTKITGVAGMPGSYDLFLKTCILALPSSLLTVEYSNNRNITNCPESVQCLTWTFKAA